jgi:hypothetical protein
VAYPVTGIKERYFDTGDDLLYSIYLKLGGTVNGIKEIFTDRTDDLLYAIFSLLGGTVVIGGDGGFDVPEFINTISLTSTQAQILDFGTVPGGNDIATGIVVNPDEWTDISINASNDPGTKYYVTGQNELIIKIRV